jgi:hypothetical protein
MWQTPDNPQKPTPAMKEVNKRTRGKTEFVTSSANPDKNTGSTATKIKRTNC